MVRHHNLITTRFQRTQIRQPQGVLCCPVHLLTSQVPLVIDRLRARGYHRERVIIIQICTSALGLRHDARRLRHNYRYHIRLHSSRRVAHRHHVIIRIRRCHTG